MLAEKYYVVVGAKLRRKPATAAQRVRNYAKPRGKNRTAWRSLRAVGGVVTAVLWSRRPHSTCQRS
jgi:hypothetical protein